MRLVDEEGVVVVMVGGVDEVGGVVDILMSAFLFCWRSFSLLLDIK